MSRDDTRTQQRRAPKKNKLHSNKKSLRHLAPRSPMPSRSELKEKGEGAVEHRRGRPPSRDPEPTTTRDSEVAAGCVRGLPPRATLFPSPGHRLRGWRDPLRAHGVIPWRDPLRALYVEKLVDRFDHHASRKSVALGGGGAFGHRAGSGFG